jgi:hypothetical protein
MLQHYLDETRAFKSRHRIFLEYSRSEVLAEMNIKIVVFLDIDSIQSGRQLRTFPSNLLLKAAP